MRMKLSENQINAVLLLPGPKRYAYFVKMVADQNTIWGLYYNGWALAKTTDSGVIFPIWPAEEYASICAVKEWNKFLPKSISMSEFLNTVIPELKDENSLLGVFPTPNEKGVIPAFEQILLDLKTELSRIE